MNFEKLKTNVGAHVQLVPIACKLDAYGRPRPPIDDDWFVEEITDDHIKLTLPSGHFVLLGKDHVHHFTSNPQRSVGGRRFGFLSLHVQVFVQGARVWVRPTVRPGEAVPPPPVIQREHLVDLAFPTDSGLQQRLEQSGFRLVWSLERHVARRVQLEGWEVVVEPDRDGTLATYRVRDPRDDMILLKKAMVAG